MTAGIIWETSVWKGAAGVNKLSWIRRLLLWRLKILAKIILSRLPFGYAFWKRLNVDVATVRVEANVRNQLAIGRNLRPGLTEPCIHHLTQWRPSIVLNRRQPDAGTR